jgi:hypothetical protein
MAVTVSIIGKEDAIEIAVSDKLHKEDYDVFVPHMVKAIAEHGKIRLLFDMHNFHGWDTAAVWEDIKFGSQNFNHFERIAMIGEKKWERAMAVFCKPFTTGKVKYFDRAEKEQAKEWLLA